jgi:hypothetical protein
MGSKLDVDWGLVLAVGWRFSLSGLDMLMLQFKRHKGLEENF